MYKRILLLIFASVALAASTLCYETRRVEVEENDPRYMKLHRKGTIDFTLMTLSIITLYSALICTLCKFWQMSATARKMLTFGMLATLLLTASLTENTKKLVGRPRPDYFDRIKVDESGRPIRSGRVIEDGRKSFPSGHTSMIFCTMSFVAYTCSLYGRHQLPIVVLSALLLLLACGVGWTRIYDNRHFLSDVLVGAAGGVLCTGAVVSVISHNKKDWL